jgi:uncharacterized protein YkwD
MIIWKKIKNNWLVAVSVISCMLSSVIFISFLLQSSSSQKYALANGYSPEQIIFAVNKERVKKDLPALTVNEKLMSSSHKKATDMVEKNYFSHFSPVDNKKWSDFIKESGYNYVVAGENLANGFDTVDKMVEAWMNSPSHRENILNKEVDETGVAISYGKLDDKPTVFVVQEFGKLDKDILEKVKNSNEAEILDSTDPKSLQNILIFTEQKLTN